MSLPRSKRDEAGQSPEPLRDSGIGPDSRAQFRLWWASATPQLILYLHRPRAQTDRPCVACNTIVTKVIVIKRDRGWRSALSLTVTKLNAFEATSHVPRDKIEAWKPGKTELKNEELALAAINLAEQDIARREEEEPEHAKEEDHKEAKNMLENITDMLADPSKLLGYFS